MAAKVVMVAVPAVLGIASVRVYTVNEAPTEGLVSREKLNIYTPLPGSAQAKFVPLSPGVIERSLTTTRESALPFVQAVKGACISVKRGTVNLYHAGEDAYYFLIDPPPDFLPRFGTITMAGLLGMFLARKGSGFKRLAVPLGLMSAGASVCYPAQAVAVLKVTGKKVHAAGQWSGAAVSSLLTSKEPVAEEIVASQSKSATEPNPDSALAEDASPPSSTTETPAQSSTIPEAEVESAESTRITDEPVVTVTPENGSSVTLTEISPDQAPTETGAAGDIPADTRPAEATPSSEPETTEAAPVESASSSEATSAPEASDVPAAPDATQAAGDVSADTRPAEATPSSEPETTEAAPVESASSSEATSAPEASDVPAASDATQAADDIPADTRPAEATLSSEPETTEAAPVESASSSEATSAPEASDVPAASDATQAPDDIPADTRPAEPTSSSEPETSEAVPVESNSAPEASDVPAEPAVESAEPAPAADSETPNPPATPPAPEQPAAEKSKEGSAFKTDPALMDFGQSSPEDEDLYSTRS
ncbi:MICOS complex subunit MIC27 isoform X2 [Leuresthes tenuis]|uniref:MICOS complex subunit MIC27 isoform X2 n=1 Tax=Leuresthes tenuis TaxID=355514 RepID=UPI003B513DDE